MSQETVQAVLEKLGTDSSFRDRMTKDAVATLDKDYPGSPPRATWRGRSNDAVG